MTFGVCSALKQLWLTMRDSMVAGKKPAPIVIETAAILERIIAFAHTGNVRVLSTTLMRPMWIVSSLLETGMPTFNPAIFTAHNLSGLPLTITLQQWPVQGQGRTPATASKRSQVLTYGPDHYQASSLSRPRTWSCPHVRHSPHIELSPCAVLSAHGVALMCGSRRAWGRPDERSHFLSSLQAF